MEFALSNKTFAELQKLSGIVNRITFHSAESGYSVLKVNSFQKPNEVVTVIIYQTKVFAGATFDFYGEWITHPSYGLQFKASKIVETKPATTYGLEKYLGSGLIKGVGPATAKKIVKHFKEKTLQVFDNNIERLLEVNGIAKLKLEMIQKAWVEHQEIKEVMVFLQGHDISTLYAVKIYRTYRNSAVEIVKNNPYRLASDINGIGFLSADKIAISIGLSPLSPERLKAAIDHVLQNARQEGHCYLTQKQITASVNELLSSDVSEGVDHNLSELEKKDELKTRLLTNQSGEEQKCYYAHSLFYDELYIATRVKQLILTKIEVNSPFLNNSLEIFCRSRSITLSEEQKLSVLQIATKCISILTGGPGCGKTTTTKALVGLLLSMGKEVLLAAPTGRASQRMHEVIGKEAKTLHRLLEWDPSKGGFKRNEQNPLKVDFLVIDECSMLDVHLAAAILRAVPVGSQVLLIGDVDQLPAVGAGNVLKDLLDSQFVPFYRLTKVFRQAELSQIITYAHQINKGNIPRIESPFHHPEVWQKKVDCLFIDSEEATKEQLQFISKVKKFKNREQGRQEFIPGDSDAYDAYQGQNNLSIPAKFEHVDVDALFNAGTYNKELMEVVKSVHPWSSLHYGLSAVTMIEKLYYSIIPKYYGAEAEIQVLSPMINGSLGSNNLNKVIQDRINPSLPNKAQLVIGGRTLRLGDRVIQKRNNYDLNVFNGDIGKIIKVDNEELTLLVEYKYNKEIKEVIYEKDQLLELDLSYAITIHKSQGSEFEIVIIPLFTQHFSMLFRNLIYTGLTRAKRLAIFVGTRKALAMAVNRQNTSLRQTALKELLKK